MMKDRARSRGTSRHFWCLRTWQCLSVKLGMRQGHRCGWSKGQALSFRHSEMIIPTGIIFTVWCASLHVFYTCQIIKLLLRSPKDKTMITKYNRWAGEAQRPHAICWRHTGNRWQSWDSNEGRLLPGHLLFFITSIFILSDNNMQAVWKWKWDNIVFTYKSCFRPTLSSLSLICLCKYKEIKTQKFIHVWHCSALLYFF